MVRGHHGLNGLEFEQALSIGDAQGCLACCIPWGHKESDTTECLNWTERLILGIHRPVNVQRWRVGRIGSRSCQPQQEQVLYHWYCQCMVIIKSDWLLVLLIIWFSTDNKPFFRLYSEQTFPWFCSLNAIGDLLNQMFFISNKPSFEGLDSDTGCLLSIQVCYYTWN